MQPYDNPQEKRGDNLQPAVIGIIILLLCVVLFLTEWLPSAVTGCLGCALMVLFGVCSFEDAFGGFSDSIVILMASAMIVGIAMFQTGAAQLTGRMVIRLAHGRERLFLFISCLTAGILSMFLANTAILASFFPIIDSVCSVSPLMKRRNLVLPVACSVMLGGACTLIGCTPQLTANGILSQLTGQQMGMWDLTGPGLCLFALYLLYLMTAGYPLGERIWGHRPEDEMEIDTEETHSVLHASYDKKKLTIMLIITILMIASYILSLLPIAMTALCAALLCIITGCCSTRDIVHKLHWETIVFLASCLGLANALTVSGSGELIGQAVSSILGGISSPFVIFAILVALALFISQFITNSTAIIIVLPIALSLCSAYGFHTMPFCIGITLAASAACCTPLAAAQIAMTEVAGYEFSDYIKYCLPPTFLFLAGILIFVPLFFPLQ